MFPDTRRISRCVLYRYRCNRREYSLAVYHGLRGTGAPPPHHVRSDTPRVTRRRYVVGEYLKRLTRRIDRRFIVVVVWKRSVRHKYVCNVCGTCSNAFVICTGVARLAYTTTNGIPPVTAQNWSETFLIRSPSVPGTVDTRESRDKSVCSDANFDGRITREYYSTDAILRDFSSENRR